MVGLVVSGSRDSGAAPLVRPQRPESRRRGVPGPRGVGEGTAGKGVRMPRAPCAHAAGTLGPQGQTPTHALPRRPLFLFAPGQSQQRPSRSHPLQL